MRFYLMVGNWDSASLLPILHRFEPRKRLSFTRTTYHFQHGAMSELQLHIPAVILKKTVKFAKVLGPNFLCFYIKLSARWTKCFYCQLYVCYNTIFEVRYTSNFYDIMFKVTRQRSKIIYAQY